MTFTVLKISTVEEQSDPQYPTPWTAFNSFLPEVGDGEVTLYPANAVDPRLIRTDGATYRVGKAEDLQASVAITGSRVIFACRNFNKGGGWVGLGVGGLIVAGIISAASTSAARRKTLGQTLVGNVRYKWLVSIAAHELRFLKSSNSLHLGFRDPGGAAYAALLEIGIPNMYQSAQLGYEIAQRAAWLQASTAAPEHGARLCEFAQRPVSTRMENGWAWQLPLDAA